MKAAAHRDQLVAMLCEAAEVEHCLMCTYLYGAFSLKQGADEDLSATELEAVGRWRGAVLDIAIDEMLHLALVNNLLIALGAPPHYGRFNFPISAGSFPADVALQLAPLDEDMLDHFIYLERPRGSVERDGTEIRKTDYRRGVVADRLMPFSDDYDTVGELYEGIAASFELLEKERGAAALFVGPPSAQLSEADFRLQGLQPVASAADVRRVVDLIVRQGEGSREAGLQSHYVRFRAIRDEWRALRERRAGFVPYRPAACDPVMRPPVVAGHRLQITADPAAPLLDAANAAYGLMLRLLTFMPNEAQCSRADRAVVAEQALLLMHTVTAIGSHLTRLPAKPGSDTPRAGITFTLSRGPLGFGSEVTGPALIAERSAALAERYKSLSTCLAALAPLATDLERFARHWSAARPAAQTTPAQRTTTAVDAPDHQKPVSPPATAADLPPVDVAVGRDVTVRFDHKRCVHSRACVLGEPTVFKANQAGEWIYPDQATVQRIAIVANNCPSGAISYTAKDASLNESAPLVNLVRIRENGPLAFHATLQIGDRADGFRATLCRCGQSKNKPYCDGSHVEAHFVASGEPPTEASEPLAARDGPIAVTPTRNGPLAVRGNLELVSGTGRTIGRVTQTWLCRCGQSKNKPYCDGSHRAAGFQAEGS
jgi:CDGSH-type Zn-finger protein/uncharacterized Fe-S cluster protein YjdI